MSDDRDAPSLPPVDDTAAEAMSDAYSPELLASLLVDGDDDLAAWTIRQALADTTRAMVYDGLVSEAMHLVGDRWRSGRWTVADEHLASQTLLRALDDVRPEVGPESRIGPLAVLAGVAGEQHAIGLILLDHLLVESGWTVARLGADVPADDLGRFVQRNEARLVAITASDPARRDSVAASIRAARGEGTSGTHRVPVMVGGRLADHEDVVAELDVDWAGRTLTSALQFADSVFREIAGPAV